MREHVAGMICTRLVTPPDFTYFIISGSGVDMDPRGVPVWVEANTAPVESESEHELLHHVDIAGCPPVENYIKRPALAMLTAVAFTV